MRLRSTTLLILALATLSGACKDAGGVRRSVPPPPPPPDQIVDVAGSYCATDPTEAIFPVKVLFILDDSGSMLSSDVNFGRVAAARALIDQLYAQSPAIYFGIERFSHTVEVLTEPTFTRERGNAPGQIEWALDTRRYRSDGCTLYQAALDLGTESIMADMAANPQWASRTHYVVIFLSDGEPRVGWNCDPENPPYAAIQEKTQTLKDLEQFGFPRAGRVTIHTVYLQDQIYSINAASLLNDMAGIGEGEFRDFPNGDAIDFRGFDTTSISRDFLVNFPVFVSNINTVVDRLGLLPDSDADGLSDREEQELGTDPLLRDTDGDACSDMAESRYLSWNPLASSGDHCACSDAERTSDTDGDTLSDCEERHLGMQATSPDSDKDESLMNAPDAMLDMLEMRSNLAFTRRDADSDYDLDGMSNLDELKAHLDPLVSDDDMVDDYAYNYAFIEQQEENPRCYDFRIDNVHVLDTARVAGGKQGDNQLYVYFIESPQDDPHGSATVKVANRTVWFDGDAPNPKTVVLEPDDFIEIGTAPP